jgi:O-succinylbenzoic acid--CoA ligase
MTAWLAQQAQEHPEAIALIEGRSRLTYANLAEQAARRAAILAAHGVRPGNRVVVQVHTDLQSAIWLHAIIWLGAAAVPVEPKLPPGRMRLLIKQLRPAASIMPEADALRIGASKDESRGENGHACPFIDADQPPAQHVEALAPAAYAPARCATIMLTSGSSSAPKAVPLTLDNHRTSTLAIARRIGMTGADQWLLCLPLEHIGGLAILIRSVICGSAVHLHPRFEPAAVLDDLAENPVTLASMVPAMLQRILERQAGPASSKLRALLIGGAPAAPWLLRHARNLGWPVLPTWGMTEACSQLATMAPDEAARIDFAEHPGTVGRPLSGVEVRTASSGILQVRGPMLFSGYLGSAGEPDHGPDAEGWFSTGDIGEFVPEGDLRIAGRADEVIISGGVNVNLEAVRQRLGECPQVHDIVLVALEDARWGQRIGAVVQPRDPSADAGQLQAFVADWSRARLTPAERPLRWHIVDNIPRSAAGKPLTPACRALLEND